MSSRYPGYRLIRTSDDPPMTEAEAQAIWDWWKEANPRGYQRLCDVLCRVLDEADAAAEQDAAA